MAPIASPSWTGVWLIACTSAQLRRRPHAVTLRGEPLVLWRDAQGRAQAVADRCCHRQVPLSLGRVLGNELACRYHGWRFAGDGRCTHIPSLLTGTPVPPAARVRSYPCQEQDGFCWIWLDPTPPPVGPPAAPEMASGRWLLGLVPMACPWQAAVENMLDWCHPVHTHRWTHPAWYLHLWQGARATRLVVRPTDRGFELMDAADEPPPGEPPRTVLRYDCPDRVTLSAPLGRRRSMHLLLQVVPTADGHCHIAWAMTRWLPFGPRLRYAPGEPAVFRQDRRLLEAQARCVRADEEEVHVPGDVPTLRARLLMRDGPGALPRPACTRVEVAVRS